MSDSCNRCRCHTLRSRRYQTNRSACCCIRHLACRTRNPSRETSRCLTPKRTQNSHTQRHTPMVAMVCTYCWCCCWFSKERDFQNFCLSKQNIPIPNIKQTIVDRVFASARCDFCQFQCRNDSTISEWSIPKVSYNLLLLLLFVLKRKIKKSSQCTHQSKSTFNLPSVISTQ